MVSHKIMVFGAGGSTIGHHIVQALVRDAAFQVSVVARESSTTKYPPAVSVVRVTEDFRHDDLVKALQNQDVVVSAIGFSAQEEQYKLIDAAVAAGVQRFIPSEWGMDNGDIRNQDLSPVFKSKSEVETYLRSKETSSFSWTAVATGIWLEWALDNRFIGIDTEAHTAQYWQYGTNKISQATLPYAALATVQLLKHPEIARNQRIFLSPFEASQQHIVAALEKHQGVKYTISHADDEKIVQEAKTKWANERDENAAYQLVSAGVLLPEYNPNFLTSGKQPILESLIEMPAMTLDDVVRGGMAAHIEQTD